MGFIANLNCPKLNKFPQQNDTKAGAYYVDYIRFQHLHFLFIFIIFSFLLLPYFDDIKL